MTFEKRMVDGLYQKTTGGVWYVRRAVPTDVRQRLGGRHSFKASTKTKDYARACHARDRRWAEWDADIAEARRSEGGEAWDLPKTLLAIEAWRWFRCSYLGGHDAVMVDDSGRVLVHRTYGGKLDVVWKSEPVNVRHDDASGPLDPAAASWARWYFEEFPGAPRGAALPYEVAILLGRLQIAAREADGWIGVAGFDEALDAALKEDGPALVPANVRAAARQTFARAWLEVEQYHEAERRRADSILAALEMATAVPESIRVEQAAAPGFVPREGDKTVQEVIEAFKAAQDDATLYVKQYGHIAKALGEILGSDRPMRSITKDDVRDVYRFLSSVPTNAGKAYKGLTLAEAALRAESDGRPLLAWNTVRSYMIGFKGICSYSLERGWIDENPVDGQVPGKRDVTKRRGFTKSEMEKAFSALADDRRAGAAWWWVPAVLAFSGARANEICQLHVEDIRETDGVAYIDLSEFDADGRRLERRRLKTGDSARCIPIHSQLVKAGFLDFVARRRAAGEGPLFHELKQNALGYHSHEVSRRWGRHLDSVGLSEPSLTLHSLRHSWKDSADDARLPDYILAALGGWGGGKSAMFRYGDRCSARRVPMNAGHVEEITLGGFTFDSLVREDEAA